MLENQDYILELLNEYGMVTSGQIDEAWDYVAGADKEVGIVEALISLDCVDVDELMAMLAKHYGLETLDLNSHSIPLELIKLVPVEQAQQYSIIPVMNHDGILTIAMADPTDMETLDSMRYILNRDVDAVIAPREQILRAIQYYYQDSDGENTTAKHTTPIVGDENIEAELIAELSSFSDQDSDEDDAPIIRLVSMIISDAIKSGASDIHLEPLENRYRVRYRIDGVLHEIEGPPKYLQSNVTSRIKIMARLDIAEKRLPQDGRINLSLGDKGIDLRVSTVPTTHGEGIVMRILDKSSLQLSISELGFYADDQKMIEQIIGSPDGIFLVTGPTGSGKTTSLYAFLNTLNSPERKIITVEDPIEYQLSGINQVQADNRVGLTFSTALRSMLRQAPNIIMVGEIRDIETGNIAINASLTGHMVFSTLHTNDAPGAITRLIEMGVQPFLVASAVRAVMAQRLVRRVCKECAEPYSPDVVERKILNLSDDIIEQSTFIKGRGCHACGNTGYKGRMGIYELFILTDAIQHMIYEKAPADKIRDEARRMGMRTLREDGLRKAAAGQTTIEEVIRCTVMDLD